MTKRIGSRYHRTGLHALMDQCGGNVTADALPVSIPAGLKSISERESDSGGHGYCHYR